MCSASKFLDLGLRLEPRPGAAKYGRVNQAEPGASIEEAGVANPTSVLTGVPEIDG